MGSWDDKDVFYPFKQTLFLHILYTNKFTNPGSKQFCLSQVRSTFFKISPLPLNKNAAPDVHGVEHFTILFKHV